MDKNILLNGKKIKKVFGETDGEQFIALKGIDLEIFEGDFTVIMGSSGSGKSTLLYSLSGLDDITSGSIEYQDKNLNKFTEKEKNDFRKNEIGFIFQAIHLTPDLTAIENVSLPGYLKEKNKKIVNDRAKELLSKVGLNDKINSLPSQISGGQQQRVAIARSLINHPKIIFADEPTGALNSSSGTEVLNYLTHLNSTEKQTIVMVTHDINAALRANRLLYISDGQITHDATLAPYTEDNIDEREQRLMKSLISWGW